MLSCAPVNFCLCPSVLMLPEESYLKTVTGYVSGACFFPLSRNYTLRREMCLEQTFLGVCVLSKRKSHCHFLRQLCAARGNDAFLRCHLKMLSNPGFPTLYSFADQSFRWQCSKTMFGSPDKACNTKLVSMRWLPFQERDAKAASRRRRPKWNVRTPSSLVCCRASSLCISVAIG